MSSDGRWPRGVSPPAPSSLSWNVAPSLGTSRARAAAPVLAHGACCGGAEAEGPVRASAVPCGWEGPEWAGVAEGRWGMNWNAMTMRDCGGEDSGGGE